MVSSSGVAVVLGSGKVIWMICLSIPQIGPSVLPASVALIILFFCTFRIMILKSYLVLEWSDFLDT